jgi:uncharacterized protein (TIGR02145 family)
MIIIKENINHIKIRAMKTYIYLTTLLAIFILAGGNYLNAQGNKLVDSRDGQQYTILNIGKQVWMGENLKFETENSWAYSDKKKNANQYGRLYTYDAALNACPAGWHLPSAKEWQELINYYGGDLDAGLALRIDGTSAFNADYAGFRSKDGQFFDLGHDVNYWSATNCDDEDAWRCYIDRGFNNVVQDYFSKSGGLSVRCVQNIGTTPDMADKNL